MNKFFSFTLLLFSCAQYTSNDIKYNIPNLWSEPINDYLEIGQKKYPNDFDTRISALEVFDDFLWIGYGDTRVNMGSTIPIEFRRFNDPSLPHVVSTSVLAENQGARQRTPTDTGEERIIPFNRFNGQLWQAGYDSNNDDELWTQAIPGPERLIQGNIFVLRAEKNKVVWEKRRNIPGGEHVHDLAYLDGSVYAVGSGAANRREWESSSIYRYLWRSDDMGKTFSVFHRKRYSMGDGDTRYRALLPIGKTLYVFGYINPSDNNLPMEGRHLIVRNNKISDLNGKMDKVVVWKTWPLSVKLGLAVGNVGLGASRTFKINTKGSIELTNWSDKRVLYVTPGEIKGFWLVLIGSGTNNERFSVYRFNEASINKLVPVLELGEQSYSSIALWHEDLYLGSTSGQVYKSIKVKK
jgi:hypothetical protein